MTHLKESVKLLAVKYYLENEVTQEEVSRAFGIYVRTFQRWLYRYRNKEYLKRKSRESVSYKIRKIHVKTALKIVTKYPHISIQTLWSLLKKKHDDFNITPEHLGIVIRDNNITRKRTTVRHYPKTRYGKTVDLSKDMKKFYSFIDKFAINKIICLDEISVHAMMKPSYSRCELGKRCVMKTKNNKVFTKYTILAAISSKGLIGWKIYEKGGMTGERMVEFIENFINGKYTNHLIIMDNAGAHKNKLVKSAITKSKNYLHYSVPYRPKTNAIETWFSQFKHHFINCQGNSMTYEQLKNTVKKTIKKIKKENYLNIMNYAYKIPSTRKINKTVSNRRKKIKNYKD